MGFSFDQAIQCGMDAPHLGVGIVAGEAAAYDTYKDMMDLVIEGWHGYKATDSHSSDMDYNNIKVVGVGATAAVHYPNQYLPILYQESRYEY